MLFINDTARNGGPGRSLHSILKFLDPAVVYRALVLPRGGPIADAVASDRVADEVHFEPDIVENLFQPWSRSMSRGDFDAPLPRKAVRLGANTFRGARAVAKLSRLVRRGRFDLVYCNGSSANFAGGAVAAITGVPALWHVRYTSVPREVAGLHSRLAASRGVRRVVCVSRPAAALFGHCREKVTVIHNAIDVALFHPKLVRATLRADLGLPDEAVIFGAHGRILRRKGYVEMIRAARIVLDRLGERASARVAFVVVGDTPQDYRSDHREECRLLARELGVESNVYMVDFRQDVRPLVAGFDVAVVPSVYDDPLPRAVIESMALGKPVIAFDVGGVAEMLEDGLTGALVSFDQAEGAEGASPASVERLAATMIRYAADSGLRRRQGVAARERVERDFDARAHARAIQDEIVDAAFDAAGSPVVALKGA